MPITAFQTTASSNDPQGTNFMDATAGQTYLVNELQDIKATIRNLSLSIPWQTLVGLQGAGWTGGLVWTFLGATSASIQGDQSQATGTGNIKVGQRVRAFVTAGIIYGTISSLSVAGGNTTVNFQWNIGQLDSGLSDIQLAGDPAAASAGFNVIANSQGNPLVDLLNTTSETTLFTTTIAGNVMSTRATLRTTFFGDWLNNLTNGGLQLRCYFGGTVVLNTQSLKAVTLNASNRIPILCRWNVVNLGVTNRQHVSGDLQMGTNSLANGILGTAQIVSTTNEGPPLTGEYVGLAIDTTQAQVLQVTGQLSASSSSLEFRFYGAFVELFT